MTLIMHSFGKRARQITWPGIKEQRDFVTLEFPISVSVNGRDVSVVVSCVHIFK